MGRYLCGNTYCWIIPRNLEFNDSIFSDMVLILDSRNMMHNASISFFNYECLITSNNWWDTINFCISEILRQDAISVWSRIIRYTTFVRIHGCINFTASMSCLRKLKNLLRFYVTGFHILLLLFIWTSRDIRVVTIISFLLRCTECLYEFSYKDGRKNFAF